MYLLKIPSFLPYAKMDNGVMIGQSVEKWDSGQVYTLRYSNMPDSKNSGEQCLFVVFCLSTNISDIQARECRQEKEDSV